MNYELWDRDSLYEEVWATPMATLAKKYGISDVGLAKVCRKLSIPLPGRGHKGGGPDCPETPAGGAEGAHPALQAYTQT